MHEREKYVLDLLPETFRRLLRERGITRPTEPQIAAIPEVLSGNNILLISPTGTGKTEAVLLPILVKLLERRSDGVDFLYITPLRALNRDITDRIVWWCNKLGLRVSIRHGDTAPSERRLQAIHPPDVLVTTPETFQILLNGKVLRRHIRHVKWVVIDEIHELAESKRGIQLALNLEKLKLIAEEKVQLIGLSATVGSPDRVARLMAGEDNIKVIQVSALKDMEMQVEYPEPSEDDLDLADQIFTFPGVATRMRAIRSLIDRHKSVLVFTNTRPTAEALTSRFRIWDFKLPIGVHHGSLSVKPRTRAERGLKSGSLRAVVCTSSMELGIDIGHVDLCIQYGSPRQATRLVQRVGRSGHRVGETSKGVIIARDPDDVAESMVIARRAMSGELEDVEVPQKPLDVLSHFVAGLLIYKGGWTVEEMLSIIRRAYPYRDLDKEEFVRLLEFLSNLPQPFLRYLPDRGLVVPQSRARLYAYFHENLSMIPEIKQYLVIDKRSGVPVGVLDESFVAEYGEIGVKFVIAGEIWRIRQIIDDKIYVIPEEDIEGAVPSWVGEEIPVPFEVAQEVGFIRGFVESRLGEGASGDQILGELARIYPADVNALRALIKVVEEQVRDGHPVPTDRRLVLEALEDEVVLHAHFGTKVNRTLGRLLAMSLSELLGSSVLVRDDPYRVYLKSPGLTPEDVIEALRRLRNLRDMLKEVASRTKFFRFRIGHVARRMGVVSKKASLSTRLIDQLVSSFRDTPLFEETLKEVMSKDLDAERTERIVRAMQDGGLEVIISPISGEPSPIARIGLHWVEYSPEYVPPAKSRLMKITSVRARLLSGIKTFVCLECCEYVEERRVFEVLNDPKCPVCSSSYLAITEEAEVEVLRAISGAGGRKWTKLLKKLKRRAELVSKYGPPAIVVLSSKILTEKDAEEILEREGRISGKLFEMIMEAERMRLARR